MELFEDLTVWENIAVADSPVGLRNRLLDAVMPGRFRGSARVTAVRQFRLESHLTQYPSELDHAARRRVAIARAFAAEPRILLLDEPAAGLDGSERVELGQEMRRLVAATGVGVLVVEHDVAFVFGICDRVIALEGGRVDFGRAPAEVRRDPKVLAAYLGEPTSPAAIEPGVSGNE